MALVSAVLLAALVTYVLGRVGGPTPQWERLSFIATVVGAAFTMAAVAGIAVGVVSLRQSAKAQRLQAKAHRATVEQAIRSTHNDLLKMAIDRPLLDAVWGGPTDPRLADDDPGARNYANMIVAFWQMAHHGGVITDAEVRLGARYFFTGRIGRAFWSEARTDRAETTGDDIEDRFHALIDAEYQAALGRPPASDKPLAPSPLSAVPPEPGRDHAGPGDAATAAATTAPRTVAGTAAGVVLGTALGYVLARWSAEPARRWRRGR